MLKRKLKMIPEVFLALCLSLIVTMKNSVTMYELKKQASIETWGNIRTALFVIYQKVQAV